jgi:hypothetical protein
LKELKFIHITKTGGTSIENVGKRCDIRWGRFHKKEYGWWHGPFDKKSKHLQQKYDWFMVVRNPYDRILSEFYCKWGGVGKNALQYNKKQFNNKLQDLIVNFQKRKRVGHYTPQYRYWDATSKIWVLRFENLKDDFEKLMKQYHLNIVLDRHDQSAKVPKHFSIRDFNSRTLNLIKRKYKKDFELFRYPIELPSGSLEDNKIYNK